MPIVSTRRSGRRSLKANIYRRSRLNTCILRLWWTIAPERFLCPTWRHHGWRRQWDYNYFTHDGVFTYVVVDQNDNGVLDDATIS